MVSCSEGHLRIDDDVIFRFGDILVESAVDHTSVSDNDGLEEILFPFLVPVLVFRFGICISNIRIG